jgi:hypothetical protein
MLVVGTSVTYTQQQQKAEGGVVTAAVTCTSYDLCNVIFRILAVQLPLIAIKRVWHHSGQVVDHRQIVDTRVCKFFPASPKLLLSLGLKEAAKPSERVG